MFTVAILKQLLICFIGSVFGGPVLEADFQFPVDVGGNFREFPVIVGFVFSELAFYFVGVDIAAFVLKDFL